MADQDFQEYAGQAPPESPLSQFNVINFLIKQALGRVHTVKMVKVMAVNNFGAVSPVGMLDAMAQVNQQDGGGVAQEHGTTFNLPYVRIQGGKNAIIIDPVVGDMGLALICDRDSSSVKTSKAQGNPGSFRRFDMADGVYLGGILNGTPTQYLRYVQNDDGTPNGIELIDVFVNKLQMTTNGITITDKNNNVIDMKSGLIEVTTPIFKVDGQIQSTEEITANFGTGDSVTVSQHTHTQSPDSHGDSEEPVNPPTAGT